MGNCWPNAGSDRQPIVGEDGERLHHLAMGQDKGLLHEPLVWKSTTPMTEGQLRGKRDTFWETAHIYDGQKEIWDALKAAAQAAEEEDYELAQAILTGANISLPTGRLTESYDELGSRYVVPVYCLSKPVNMQEFEKDEQTTDKDDTIHDLTGEQTTLKIRVSSLGKDVKLKVLTTSSISDIKKQLENKYGVEANKITMLFSGRVISNKSLVHDLNVPKGFIIQAIVR